MNEQVEETTVEEVKPKKLSGAQRRKDERPRVFDRGVWRLPVTEQTGRVLRGRPR